MKEILKDKAELDLLSHNIVKITIYDYVHLEEEDVRNIHRLKLRMVNNCQHSVILVAGKFTGISKEAQVLSAQDDIAENRIAKAIVTTTLAQKLVANLFLINTKPKSLIKLFNCESEALNWLKQLNG
jgi:hypothetical protein